MPLRTSTPDIGTARVGDALRERDHVRHDAVALGGEAVAEPAEARDDLVEDQQDAVLRGDLAQPLEVALGRRQAASRTGHRLDDDGRDGRGVVQPDQAQQLVRASPRPTPAPASRTPAWSGCRSPADGRRRPACCRTSCGWRPCRRPRCRRSRRRDSRARGR